MFSYTQAAMERTMKVQEVILRAMAKKITWWQAAEIIGISDRQMRRWHERYEEFGFRGLFDRRRGKPSPKKVPLAVVEKVLGLYREKYFDLNVRHFHEKLQEEHQVEISYSWVKGLLQGAGMVAKGRKRGVHRKLRPRRPLPGMLLHIDGSEHRWFQDERWYDLLVIMDDANSEIYYAQLVEEEATVPVLAGLKEVVECKGVFCALYSDRARHFWLTAEGGRGGGPRPSHAGGAGAARVGSAHDSGLLAASARTQRTQLRDLARPVAAGTALAWDPDGGGGECLSARALHRRVQSPLPSRSGATGQRLCALSGQRPGAHLLAAIRAHGEPGQHGQLSEPDFADRARALAGHAGGLHRDRAPAPGRNLEPQLWAALPRSLRRARRSDPQPETGGRQGRGKDARVEKSKSRLSHRAWKSRKVRGIPTFPPPRRLREINQNRTFHLLRKADILTC